MHLKNIPHEEVLVLAEQLPVHKGQIISKTLVQNQFVGMTLFSFSAEEEISTHTSHGDAMVQVL